MTDDLTNGLYLCIFTEIRTQPPDYFSCFLTDNRQYICISGIPDQIIRVETHIPLIIPMIRAQNRDRIDMQPVTCISRLLIGRITEQRILCRIIKSQFFKMIGSLPLPEQISLPIHLNDTIIQKTLISNLMIDYIGMCQQNCISMIVIRFLLWCIIPHWRTFSLKIMVLTCHVTRF